MKTTKLDICENILHNLMCNISSAYKTKDMEMVRAAYRTAQDELKLFKLRPFKGEPNLEDEIKKDE